MVDVIYIEDEETEALLFQIGLAPRGINVLHIPDAQPDSLNVLNTPVYQAARVLFFDLWIGAVSGMELARSLRMRGDERPFFLVTAAGNPNPALLRQLRLGFLQKPLDFGQVADLIFSLA
ncbi:MAG: response regulator [Chloroflexi bacterium]|nr:response regulator [Chloroflexota bacterium]